MKITAVRHGETQGNVEQITQSHARGELTTKGIEQAHKLAALLKDEEFSAVYCSDLKRALDTASIIMTYHAGTEFIIASALRERNLGSLDGKSYEAIPLELFDGSRLDLRAPEGESWRDVINRLTKLLNDMYEHYPNGHVLLISHGWTLRVLRFLLTDLSLEESLADHIDNASAQMWLMPHAIVEVLSSYD